MANAESTISMAPTPEERLERLLSSCRRMQQNLDHLVCALSVVDESIPDRHDQGVQVSGLLRLIITHQNEEFSTFAAEVKRAEGASA